MSAIKHKLMTECKQTELAETVVKTDVAYNHKQTKM